MISPKKSLPKQNTKFKRWKDHTHKHRSITRHPTNKSNPIPLPLPTFQLKLNIVDSVAGARFTLAVLGIDQLLAEIVVIGIIGGFFDDDLCLVVADFEDDVLLLAAAEAEFVEGGYAVGVDRDAGK